MIETIRRRLKVYQPGRIEPDGLPLAAVLVPIHDRRGDLNVVFTKRTDRVQHHRGEISFPGGAMDPEDKDLAATAIRECEEEIGLQPEHIEMIGQLDDVVTVSSFHVSVFVGEVRQSHSPYTWQPHEHEVAEVLEVPLAHLLDVSNLVEVPRQRDGQLVIMEGFRFGDHIIWGATGRMLRNFLDVVSTEDLEDCG
jgi:8-oxo-dGTP pyrophosphatase MutT (NUDIX family)